MRRLTGRIAVVCALAVLAAGGVALADVTITAQPGDRFGAPSYTIDQGENATFQNPDATSSHNVTARDRGPDGRPLFRSRTIAGGSTPVDGVRYLTTGTYRFECTLHLGMAADLQVTGSGTPVARPDIEVAIPAQSLAAVRKSRRLKVRVRAPSESRDVALIARKGARRIASKRNLDLAAGASRVIRLPLTGAGRRALEDLEKAPISLRGTVPFGRADSARRTLR